MTWSCCGPKQRCTPDDGTPLAVACAARLDPLVRDNAGTELRRLADEGERCAFVALMELLVDADRTDDLRTMAEDGDDRALVTLMQSHLHADREADLRADVERFGDITWLLGYLSERGRAAEAVAELDAWLADRPDLRERWRGHRLDLLLDAGRVDEVRAAAAAGDRAAARRLRYLDTAD